jgi:hypothetical protein
MILETKVVATLKGMKQPAFFWRPIPGGWRAMEHSL